MKCGTARKQLYLLRQPSAASIVSPVEAEVAQAEAHVAGCAACQEFFAAEERLKALLRTRAPREKASATLREQVFSRIGERPARPSHWLRPLRRRNLALAVTGLMIVVLLAVGLWFSHRRTQIMSPQIASILIEDHAHNLPGATQIASSDHLVVQSWFQGQVDFSFRLPPINDPSLIGGRLCYLQGRRAALVLYQHPQSKVSLFILDGSDVELPETGVIALDGKRCLVDTRKGYNAVLWKERGLLYGLVSDLRSAELLQMAAQF